MNKTTERKKKTYSDESIRVYSSVRSISIHREVALIFLDSLIDTTVKSDEA